MKKVKEQKAYMIYTVEPDFSDDFVECVNIIDSTTDDIIHYMFDEWSASLASVQIDNFNQMVLVFYHNEQLNKDQRSYEETFYVKVGTYSLEF